MKRFIGMMLACAATWSLAADPMRVAVLDFENEAEAGTETSATGGVTPGSLAKKGVTVLGQRLLKQDDFALIDRRDFIAQVARSRPGDPSAPAPSFLRAAQAMRADAVLRGRLQGFSAGKQTLKQGGYDVEFTRLSVRVSLEALDANDGTVLGLSSGSAEMSLRQTQAMRTTLSEDEQIQLLEKAVDAALPELRAAMSRRIVANRERPKVKISVKTTADPALVELDGVLIGSTPLEELAVYKGDHVLTIGRAGYRDVTKRILLEQDSRIEVPMIRTELTADEIKDVLDKVRMNMIIGEPGLTILPLR